MCLAVPGRILEIHTDAPIVRTGRVSFGGIVREVNLAYTPEAKVGDYVIVHAGFAISTVDEGEAAKVFEYLEAMDELAELEAGGPDSRRKARGAASGRETEGLTSGRETDGPAPGRKTDGSASGPKLPETEQ